MNAFLQANIFLCFLFLGLSYGVLFLLYNKLKLKKPVLWLTDAIVTTTLFAGFYIANLWLNNGCFSFWVIMAVIIGFALGTYLFAKLLKLNYTKSTNDRKQINKPN